MEVRLYVGKWNCYEHKMDFHTIDTPNEQCFRSFSLPFAGGLALLFISGDHWSSWQFLKSWSPLICICSAVNFLVPIYRTLSFKHFLHSPLMYTHSSQLHILNWTESMFILKENFLHRLLSQNLAQWEKPCEYLWCTRKNQAFLSSVCCQQQADAVSLYANHT